MSRRIARLIRLRKPCRSSGDHCDPRRFGLWSGPHPSRCPPERSRARAYYVGSPTWRPAYEAHNDYRTTSPAFGRTLPLPRAWPQQTKQARDSFGPRTPNFTAAVSWPKNKGTYRLISDHDMVPWCYADIDDKDKGRVLAACKLGGRCEITGTITGHGEFGWVKITSVSRKP
jgi:hypothetical protein